MVGEAQGSLAPIQRVAEVDVCDCVPLLVAAALITGVAWAIWCPEP